MRDPGDSVITDAVPLTLRLPPVVHAELKARCEADGRSLNSAIIAAVQAMLDDKAPARRRLRRGTR